MPRVGKARNKLPAELRLLGHPTVDWAERAFQQIRDQCQDQESRACGVAQQITALLEELAGEHLQLARLRQQLARDREEGLGYRVPVHNLGPDEDRA